MSAKQTTLLATVLALALMGFARAAELPTKRAKVEVVFCLDTTGSMGGLLAGAQQKIWSIVNGIATGQPAPEIKVGLVAFRDRSDAYVTQLTDLTANLDDIHAKLFALKAQGGGDGPESVNQALHEAVSQISWASKDEKVYRVIFLVGDAPPHMDYSDDVKYAETCKAAVLKDIVINTVRCGTDRKTEEFWQDVAAKSEGRYTSIAQDGGVQVVATPYDGKLAELSGKLVSTGVYAGRAELRKAAEGAQRRAMADAEELSKAKDEKVLAVAADKSEFRGKSAAAAKAAPETSPAQAGMGMGSEAGEADLVTAYARDGAKALEGKQAEELPGDMQKLSAEEREAFLKQKSEERDAIQKQIGELSKQRGTFIQTELKKRGGDRGFDGVVLEMLKEQGAKKGISYGESK